MQFKVVQSPDPFSRVSKTILNDPRISWAAKGIAAYMVGKPDGWKMRITDLVNHGCDGKHLIRAAINELRRFGYARYVQPRVAGRLGEGIWEITDKPIFESLPENQNAEPLPENQEPARQEPEGQHHSKNDSNENDSSKKEAVDLEQLKTPPSKPSSPQPPNKRAAPLPDLPEELQHLKPEWERWQEHRREINKPLTPSSAREQIGLMEVWTDEEVREAISQSTNAGRPGLYRPGKIVKLVERTEPAGCNL